MSDLIQRAAEFAKEAHTRINQRRKYTDEPYIVHPETVAATVASVTDDATMIAAAWLHDVVEDTSTTIEEINQEFGPDVARLVADLTNPSKSSDGNRQTRKAIDRKHSAEADPRAKTIKLADMVDNLTGIADLAPQFARKYLHEKGLQLKVLEEGDAELRRRVARIIEEELQKLDSDG